MDCPPVRPLCRSVHASKGGRELGSIVDEDFQVVFYILPCNSPTYFIKQISMILAISQPLSCRARTRLVALEIPGTLYLNFVFVWVFGRAFASGVLDPMCSQAER
jgi:hypothetical protein